MISIRELGSLGYAEAAGLQQQLVKARRAGETEDELLFVEHPHVITLGRNAHIANVLASPEILERAGISVHETNRGGDVTYHGAGQIVAYPILDLNGWKRDVHWYVRTLEQVIIETLADFGIASGRQHGMTGVWANGAKIAAIGVHISRWITSHGFALNHTTDLSYFQYIVPCGLTKPVTSIQALGVNVAREAVVTRLAENFLRIFDREKRTYGRSDAADGREHRRGNLDKVAQEAR